MQVKLTPKQYAADGGFHCPVCGSRNIDGLEFESAGRYIFQLCACFKCDNTWENVYELKVYRHLENLYHKKED